jgi:SAM-dependent methyltransferase
VLEHVPDYYSALSELCRVLKPGGMLVMTAPFNPHIQEHSVRARMNKDGSIEHLLEPEYHVDPLRPEGCLCYYHFGWAMLDDLRAVGFKDAYVLRYASRELGYLGPDPLMFIAVKPS